MDDSASADAPQLNPVFLEPPTSRRTAPRPYPKMVVVGLGADGSAGKLSAPVGRGPLFGAVGFEEPGWDLAPAVVHCTDDGVEARPFGVELPLAEGRAGNEETGGRDRWEPAEAAHEDDCALDRCDCWVEFFSFRTRVLWRWAGAAEAAGELAVALAQPPLDVAAPRMPESPGNVG